MIYFFSGLALVIGAIFGALHLIRLNRKLRESEARYRLFTENAFDVIWSVDANANFTYVSPAVERMRGYTAEEVKKYPLTWTMPPESSALATAYIKHYLETGELPANRVELQQGCKDGSLIWVEISVTIMRDASGANIGVFGITRDITSRKEIESALISAKERAEEATRMKDKFLSLAAHDLKSPLSSIIGYLYIFANDRKNPLNDEQLKLTQSVLNITENLSDLIGEILNMHRLQSGKFMLQKEFLNARDLAQTVCSRLRQLAVDKKINLLNHVPPHARIYADGSLFLQAVQNLVSNAIKFSREGDTISIHIPDPAEGSIAIEDTGIGIAKARLESLFTDDKASTTPGTAGEKGTGLGLHLCREIMKTHGGSISAKSEEGKGSAFFLTFPILTPKILIVEDDQEFVKVVSWGLNNAIKDLQIFSASDGIDALEKINETLPSLIITDVLMAKMDGLALLEAVRKMPLTRNIPVIVVTASNNESVREKALQVGANEFLLKPITINDFISRVKQLLNLATN